MGDRRIFSKGGGKFGDAKKLTTFLVVTLKTQVFTVTILMHKTLYDISREKCPQNISFLKGAPVPPSMHNGTMASPSLLLNGWIV